MNMMPITWIIPLRTQLEVLISKQDTSQNRHHTEAQSIPVGSKLRSERLCLMIRKKAFLAEVQKGVP